MGDAIFGREGRELPPSLWAFTASQADLTFPLEGRLETETLVVGGGYTGLSTALHLAEEGMSVVVLEANEIGWGASGRNNGQVIPGLKMDPEEVEASVGREAGKRLWKWAGDAPGAVFDLVARHGIDCSPVNEGWVQPAYTTANRALVEHRCAQWKERGAPVELIGGARLEAMLGTHAFQIAWLDRRGGSIHPLNYARGLARAAMRAGASVHSGTTVLSIVRQGGEYRVRTERAEVRAKNVVVATNAYSGDLLGKVRRSFVPIRTAQVASAVLDGTRLEAILPGRQVASDTRRLLTSFRRSPDNRLVMGGAGATGGAHKRRLEHHLHRAAAELFGHLGEIRWEFGWSGFLALTTDHLPHLHSPAPNLYVPLGCNGRGIALMTGMGKLVAEKIRGSDDLPLAVTPTKRVSFHGFRNFGISVATRAKRWRDARDRERSRS